MDAAKVKYPDGSDLGTILNYMLGMDVYKFKVTKNENGTLHVIAKHISHDKSCNAVVSGTTDAKDTTTYSEVFDSIYYCDSDEFIGGYRFWTWFNKTTALYS